MLLNTVKKHDTELVEGKMTIKFWRKHKIMETKSSKGICTLLSKYL